MRITVARSGDGYVVDMVGRGESFVPPEEGDEDEEDGRLV